MALNLTGIGNLFETSKLRNLGFGGEQENPIGQQREREIALAIQSASFTPRNPDVDDITYGVLGTEVTVSNGTVSFIAPLNLPNGVRIKQCVVKGNNAARLWFLRRFHLTTLAVQNIFTATMNTTDTVPAAGLDVVDNETYSYFIRASSLGATDTLTAAQLIYLFEERD